MVDSFFLPSSEVFFEFYPCFVFGLFLAPLFTCAIEKACVADVLVASTDELRVMNGFIAPGYEALTLF